MGQVIGCTTSAILRDAPAVARLGQQDGRCQYFLSNLHEPERLEVAEGRYG